MTDIEEINQIAAIFAARAVLGPNPNLKPKAVISYAASLGYVFTESDAREIIETSYPTETVEEAVNDYLDAFER